MTGTIHDAENAETDIIVVGAGIGGMSAALSAHREGASVTVLEARDCIGGNSSVSTGYIALAGTSRQRRDGIKDDPETFLQDMRAEADRERENFGLFFDEEVAQIYATHSAEAFDFLDQLGIRFGAFAHRPLQHTAVRMLTLADTSDFRTRFEAAFEEVGLRPHLNTRAKRLITEGDRVVGVRALTPEGERVWYAKKAVILAAGGYQASPEVRGLYQPESAAKTPYYGITTSRGDGQIIGQAVGGQLVNMTGIPMYVRAPSGLVEACIAVNSQGLRFHDETGPYRQRVATLQSQPDGIGYYIYDERTASKKAQLIRWLPRAPKAANSHEDLAALIGCPAKNLRKTVEEWNLLMRSANPVDSLFQRVIAPISDADVSQGDNPVDNLGIAATEVRPEILTPPFYAAPMIVGASFTFGGFKVTTSMQVLDIEGTPIPGLLAVGDCAGSVNAVAGLGGIHHGSGSTLGMIAGRYAARTNR